MIFSVKEARRQLLEKGIVYTFRTHRAKQGRDWANDGRCKPKICDINVELIMEVTKMEDLMPFTFANQSGFKSAWDWHYAIKKLYPKMTSFKGFLYKVTKR